MQPPAIYNPIIKQGASFQRWMFITDDTGTTIPLDGAVFAGQVKSADGLQVLTNITCVVLDLVTGKIQLSIEDTSILPSTDGRPQLPYDIYITLGSGDRICPVEGLISVEAATTTLEP